MPLIWQSTSKSDQSAVLISQRIVSLVPSQTELLFDLGLGERVVGVTKFCVRPVGARQQATVVGGTKQLDFEKIAALRPDLILANKEENTRADVERLAERYSVWVSDITDLPGALAMIWEVGLLTGTPEAANLIASDISHSFARLVIPATPIPAAYLIWRQPYMVAGSGTFINSMLGWAGFSNIFGHLGRYPEITAAQLAAAAPARVLLSSEPYPFKEKHLAELQAICPRAQVQLVDGELFSWYGSRLRHSAAYFDEMVKW